jgi:hypothetical protein
MRGLLAGGAEGVHRGAGGGKEMAVVRAQAHICHVACLKELSQGSWHYPGNAHVGGRAAPEGMRVAGLGASSQI